MVIDIGLLVLPHVGGWVPSKTAGSIIVIIILWWSNFIFISPLLYCVCSSLISLPSNELLCTCTCTFTCVHVLHVSLPEAAISLLVYYYYVCIEMVGFITCIWSIVSFVGICPIGLITLHMWFQDMKSHVPSSHSL